MTGRVFRAAALLAFGLVVLASAQAKDAPVQDIVAAKAACVSNDGERKYTAEFTTSRSSLVVASLDGATTTPFHIGAIVQLGHTAVVFAVPTAGQAVTGAFFFGATTKAAFYEKGGALLNEDKCQLLSSDADLAIDAPKGGVK